MKSAWHLFENYDVVVSNPPYIAEHEGATMHKNVLSYEPHNALFVPDNDALLFYRKIAAFARTHVANGLVYTEINERFGTETANLFTALWFCKC